MQTTARGRRHLTATQRDKILRACQRSSLTRKEFAARVGIGVSTLHTWLRQAALRQGGGGSQFVEAPNWLAARPPAPAYKIQWPSGLSLEVRAGFVARELGVLLATLPTV